MTELRMDLPVGRVVFQQPVIPHYRVPFFEGLHGRKQFELEVLASPAFPGAPDSVRNLPEWADTGHECVGLWGGRLQWQKGMRLPESFGPEDVLVFSGNPRILSTIPLVAQARRQGAATVWWGHRWSSTSRAWRFRLRMQLMRLADVVLVYDDHEVPQLHDLGHWGIPVLAVNNAIDQSGIAAARASWNAERLRGFARENGFDPAKLLLFCGRLRVKAQLNVALQALRLLVDEDPGYRLAVIGSGDEEPRLRAECARLGLAAHVLWLGPIYDERMLAPWFLSAACFVYPGGIGLSLLHAFGYGLPVVTHDRPKLHNPEIGALVDGENGLLFEHGNAAGLAVQLARICRNGDLRARLSAGALGTITTRNTLDGMIDRMLAAIRVAREVRSRGRDPRVPIQSGAREP